jgi:2-polyprenyl-3-methyl-5-hydroxy-6-metoxy-1,4-benzoquinol methylase
MWLADLQQHLHGVTGKRGRLVVLAGGEPALRRDLPRLLAAVRSAGCRPGLITSGRPLLYPKVRAMLREVGLAYLRIQFFGVGAEHDRTVAVPGAFEQAIGGVRAWLAESDGECDVDLVLSTRGRQLATVPSEVEHLAAQIGSPAVQLIVAPDPARIDEQRDSQELRAVVEELSGWNDDTGRPLLAWEGLGSSELPGSSLDLPPPVPLFLGTDPAGFCVGVVEHIRRAGLAYRVRTCANSFNYVRSGTVVPYEADAAACRAHVASDVDPLRQAWLIEGDTLVLHVSDTGDFKESEIRRIKDEHCHLFVDRQAPGTLDDFVEGMRRVLPDPACGQCLHRDGCGHRFGMIEGPPFAKEEEWISAYVADLRGRVLDVGCGEQLYKDRLIPLVRSGAVDYTGIDPDEHSLGRLRFALPEARFYAGGIEAFRDEPESYDHILCLRSLNHVINVDEALARMAALLKPAGRLLLVECTPFALLRQPEQVAAADRAPRAGHQHLRNFASEEVVPYARRRGLRVLHHQPASRESTNEWILLLGRGARL